MKTCPMLIVLLVSITSLLSAGTNALIEVNFFKTWVTAEENVGGNFNLAIKNTGEKPFLLAKHPVDFEIGQLVTRPLPRDPQGDSEQEREYKMIKHEGFFSLLPGETHIYEGRKFLIDARIPFSEKMRFTVSVYLGNGFWLDSEPMTLKGVVPDSEEKVATITDGVNPHQYELAAITYKGERWLYSKLGGYYFSVCPLSLTNKIRAEPHDGKRLHKIWDGEKSMIYLLGQSTLTEGPDENDVFGKWTRERKQKAEADNAEVRRKKAEGD